MHGYQFEEGGWPLTLRAKYYGNPRLQPFIQFIQSKIDKSRHHKVTSKTHQPVARNQRFQNNIDSGSESDFCVPFSCEWSPETETIHNDDDDDKRFVQSNRLIYESDTVKVGLLYRQQPNRSNWACRLPACLPTSPQQRNRSFKHSKWTACECVASSLIPQ